MNNDVDKNEQKEDIVLGDSSTNYGNKVSSVRLEDENGKLLWSPDDIGIYSEVRTSIISYILEKLIKKDGVYLKIEDVHHTDGSYRKSEIDSMISTINTKFNDYFLKSDFNASSFVGEIVKTAVEEYIDNLKEDEELIATRTWVTGITGIRSANNIGADSKIIDYFYPLSRDIKKVLSLTVAYAFNLLDSNHNYDLDLAFNTVNAYNPSDSSGFNPGVTLPTQITNLNTKVEGYNTNLTTKINNILTKIGPGTGSDGFEEFNSGINQTTLIGAINSLHDLLQSISNFDALQQMIATVREMQTRYDNGEFLLNSQVSQNAGDTSTTNVPSSKIFNDLYKNTGGIPAPPNADGNYMLKCSVSSGAITYTWEAVT